MEDGGKGDGEDYGARKKREMLERITARKKRDTGNVHGELDAKPGGANVEMRDAPPVAPVVAPLTPPAAENHTSERILDLGKRIEWG